MYTPPVTHLVVAPARPVDTLQQIIEQAGIFAPKAYQFRTFIDESIVDSLVGQLRLAMQLLIHEIPTMTFHVMIICPQATSLELKGLKKLTERISAYFVSTQNGFVTTHGFTYEDVDLACSVA